MNTPEILNIGLLLCDDVPADARQQYGDYAGMFQQGLDATQQRIKLTPLRCFENQPLPEPADFDGYLISGSKCSVYENRPWIIDLMAFIERCWTLEIKVVGICFGHQLIAHALGGKTEKAQAGWGLGIQAVDIIEPQPWMDGFDRLHAGRCNIIVIHQDQVVETPDSFRVIAANDFCPNSMIVADGKMLGIQGHPEFSKEYCRFRTDSYRQLSGESVYQAAQASLQQYEPDSAIVLGWVGQFLRAS